MTISLHTLVETPLTALSTMITWDPTLLYPDRAPHVYSTHLLPTPTLTLFCLILLGRKLSILIDHLGYFDWSIGASDIR